VANYSDFYTAAHNMIRDSDTLDAVIDDAPANHVRQERYVLISKDGPLNHDAYLEHGPLVYLIPSSCEYAPMTADHEKTEAILEMDVHHRVVNATAATFVTHVKFVDDLCIELMKKADGTGGTGSWLSGIGIKFRCSSAQVEQLGLTECRTKVRLKAQLLGVV